MYTTLYAKNAQYVMKTKMTTSISSEAQNKSLNGQAD